MPLRTTLELVSHRIVIYKRSSAPFAAAQIYTYRSGPLSRPDVVKIDVEGAEAQVLKGTAAVLRAGSASSVKLPRKRRWRWRCVTSSPNRDTRFMTVSSCYSSTRFPVREAPHNTRRSAGPWPV